MSGGSSGDDAKPPSSGPAGASTTAPGRDALKPDLPKRFYKLATTAPVAGGFGVLLDGRPLRTPSKRALVLPNAALAAGIAVEWNAQGERIDPARMWLTKLANTAIDAVLAERDAVAADIVKYAGSDLVCYRADAPRELVSRQQLAWDPVLAWASEELGARFLTAAGVMHVTQDTAALAAFSAAVVPLDHWRLTALHVMTTLSGSALLALAVVRGRIDADDAWSWAHVDEDWQISQWGADAEAAARRALRLAEWRAAVEFHRAAA